MSTLKNLTLFIFVFIIMILYAMWKAAPLLAYILLAWIAWKILKPLFREVVKGFKDGYREAVADYKAEKNAILMKGVSNPAQPPIDEIQSRIDAIFDPENYK